VVTADGRLRTVSADSDPDLFWAMRGCKGNFGVVTALEFDLFPVSRFYGGSVYFPGEHLAEVLHAWRAWVVELPEEATSSVAVQRLPPLPELPAPLRGANVVHLRFSHLGSEQEGERLLAPMRAVAPAVLDAVSDLPYTAVRHVHNDPEHPMPYWDRTTSLREFPAAAVDAFVEVLGPQSGSPLVNVEIRHLSGALDREPAVPNAVSSRGVPFALFGFGVGGPDQADLMRSSLAGVIDALAPWAEERLVANFLSPDEATTPAEMACVFGAQRFARLVEIKKAYDPANMFRINHNIPAAL
jgi:FAD/FMN-containing dehydrogenase